MVVTNLELITDALRQIGLLDENEVPSAEQGQVALRRLNQIMATWAESDLTFPSWFPQTDLSAQCPIPDWAELAVTGALSIAMAAAYGVTVSEEVAAVAESARAVVLRKRMSQQLQPVDVSHLPAGEAHRGVYDIRNL